MNRAYILLRDAFEINGRWFTRKELARVIGRAGWTLQAQDLIALDTLMSEQVIEGRKVKHAYGGAKWEYRRVTK